MSSTRRTACGSIVLLLIFLGYYYDVQLPQHRPTAKGKIAPVKKLVLPGKPVEISFEAFDFEVTRMYVTGQKREELEAEDMLYTKKPNEANYVYVTNYQTSAGKFQVVRCHGRYSINPKAFHNWANPEKDTILLPNDMWMFAPDLIKTIVELEGKTFIITQHVIYEWVTAHQWKIVVIFKGNGRISTNYSFENGLWGERYLEVQHSQDTKFAGLLEYKAEKWVCYAYEKSLLRGMSLNYLHKENPQDSFLTLQLGEFGHPARREITFDLVTGKFAEVK